MLGILWNLLGFFSDDILDWAIRKKFHDSFRIISFIAEKSGRGPKGTSISLRLKIKNKLWKENQIMSKELNVDGNKATIISVSETLSAKQTKEFNYSTDIYHSTQNQSHTYEIRIIDIFDRKYNKKYTTII
ncbi:MAG: hypothetical protein WC450_02325 [Candidatus Omnitrophota bacterium]|jgi:hypothetical protein